MLYIIQGAEVSEWHTGQPLPSITERTVEFQASDDELSVILAALRRTNSVDCLTPRENEILKLVAAGSLNREIAVKIGIGYKTVETHRNNLFKKIGVHNRVQATRWAFEHGVVQIQTP